jgi:hypothetical protein
MMLHTILRKNTIGVAKANASNSVFAQNGMHNNFDMCATKVQHSHSATISVKPSTHTV